MAIARRSPKSLIPEGTSVMIKAASRSCLPGADVIIKGNRLSSLCGEADNPGEGGNYCGGKHSCDTVEEEL